MRIIIFTLLIFIHAIAFGQYGSIEGKIIDKNNKKLRGVIVRIMENKNSVLSNYDGNYSFDSIQAGEYTLMAMQIGVGDTIIKNVIVDTNTITRLNIKLSPFCEFDAHRKNKTCPKCGKRKYVVPIVYGLPIGDLDEERYYYAGCLITNCDPNWYCKKDKIKF